MHKKLHWRLVALLTILIAGWLPTVRGAAQPNIIYILADDVGETKNVADQHHDVLKQIQILLKEARQPSKPFPSKVLDGSQLGRHT